jgi:hypothetical protein
MKTLGMAESTFTLKYDGRALDDGTMPVRELAPALLALGEIFTDASQSLFPEHPPVALNVKATSDGSFLVHLVLQGKDLWDHLLTLSGSPGASALSNLETFVVDGGVGIFAFIQWLKGRKIKSQDSKDVMPGHVRITTEDGDSIEVPTEVVTLFQRKPIRQKAVEVIAPLKREGVSEMEFQLPSGESGAKIEKKDVAAFEEAQEDDDVLSDEVQPMVVEILSLSFSEGNKWRFSLGTSTISAAIEDEGFLAQIDSGEPFAKGDMLRCRMRVVARRRPKGLHTEYHLLEVVEHLRRNDQMTIENGEPT